MQTSALTGCFIGQSAIAMSDSHKNNEAENAYEEDHAGERRAEPQSALVERLRKQITERSSQRAGQNIGEPE